MNSNDPQLLVSTDWLAAHLSAPGPAHPRRQLAHAGRRARRPRPSSRQRIFPARASSTSTRSPTAVDLPHMAPTLGQFVSEAGAWPRRRAPRRRLRYLGLFSAARVWWTVRLFGKPTSRAGRRPAEWRADGRPIEDPARRSRPPLHRRPPRRAGARRHQVAATAKLATPRSSMPAAGPLPGRGPRAAAGPAVRPYAGREERPVWTAGRGRPDEVADELAPALRRRRRPRAADVTTCGSGVTARSSPWPWRAWAGTMSRSTMAPGPNGAPTRISRSRRG